MIKKIKRLVVNLFVSIIPHKAIRKKCRTYLIDFSVLDFWHYFKFSSQKISTNSILLTEINPCHAEVISGYLAYFQKLGFSIDILISTDIALQKPFIGLSLDTVHIYTGGNILFRLISKSKKLLAYKHVVLMSSVYYPNNTNRLHPFVSDIFPHFKRHQSLYYVEHDISYIPLLKDKSLLKQNRLITLGHFKQGIFATPVLFGKRQITPKNEVTTFITVGAIQNFRKNHNALIQAAEELIKAHLNFKIIIIGKGTLNNLPSNLHKYITLTGRLNFPDMFSYLEKADFFLPLLDAQNPEHNRYITTGVTGSAQLIYAFSKIPVLHPKFADFYMFNQENAILSTDLAQGMKEAILMSQSTYSAKQKKLLSLTKKLEAESFKNLTKIFLNS